jgi:hypothetical protein
MLTLHVINSKGGWCVKFALEDPASILIEQKIVALDVAQRIAARHQDAAILLYETDGLPPRSVELKRRRAKLLSRVKAS